MRLVGRAGGQLCENRGVDLPELTDLRERMVVVTLPLRVPFRGVTTREIALLHGPRGWGEFSPFLEYPPAEAAAWLRSAIESAYAGWPAPRRTHIPVNATVPAVAARSVADVLARFEGCTTAKVKVAEPGQTLADDLARVGAVREVLGESGRIRIDANGGWSVAEAVRGLSALAPLGLEYAEQPCASVEDLLALRTSLSRNGVDVLIAADESIRKASDPLRVARLGACDLFVVKVAPLGGVRRVLDLVAAAGLPAVVSSALESSVGIRAGVALAAALPDLPYACGLGTVALLAADVATPSMVPVGGALPVTTVTVDDELRERHTASPDRQRWWRQRLDDSYAALTGAGS